MRQLVGSLRGAEGGRKAANQLAQSGAIAQNTLASSSDKARTRICTGGIMSRKRLARSPDLARKRIAGKDVSLEERAEKIMAERHAALGRRAQDFAGATVASGSRANDAIDAKAPQAR